MNNSNVIMKYRPKKLVNGTKLGLYGGNFVAVPDKRYKGHVIDVEYLGTTLRIDNWERAETYRHFKDKHGGKDYVLGYFRWPIV